jgi:hypothetical protein
MCSFDCGPIAWGCKGYVPFSEIAQQRMAWNSQHSEELQTIFEVNDKIKKRQYALSSLSANHNFEVQYDKPPFSTALDFEGFMVNRNPIRKVIESTQEKINGVIMAENLSIKPLFFIPEK